MNVHLTKISPTRLLLGGYCTIILIGTLLLSLPAASRDGAVTPVSDAFFTATSAACVTGLVRFDTFSHWSLFGQIVILLLIQVGGMGFVTIVLSMYLLSKQKIGLYSRILMRDAISAPSVGGIVRMTRFILTGTVLIEGLGALALAAYFCPRFGPAKGIYYSVFHSISAFCNAGFDLMGTETPFSSLTAAVGNWYVNFVIMALIIVGGLGFFVWQDLLESRFRFSGLRLHSKLVVVMTVTLTFGGAILLFVLENSGGAFSELETGEKVLASLFQSVTLRTAGFNTVDLAAMSESSTFLMICLMLVGGSTGSTAGGMKTTTAAVLVLSIFTTFFRKRNVECFGRRLETGITRTASCIFMLYLGLLIGSTITISAIEELPILTVMFETASAVATVGLTLGITPGLSMASKLILAFLMFFGRAGSLTMLLAFSSDRGPVASKKPLEKIQIG
ncbi:MAG: Trk family potassium uptake protein [Lachnospiraceae bacterium]|nr:Trk family potassium uptake protein [Lachnospiraceae bacterium]